MSLQRDIALLLLPVLVLLLTFGSVYASRRRQRRLALFATERLVPILMANDSPARRKWKQFLFLTAILLVGFSLCRPQFGEEERVTKSRSVDLLFAVDVSKSMLAEDMNPNRLERTKLLILDLLHQISGHRVGLIAFAGDAFLQCPLTLDYGTFTRSLTTLDTDIIPVPGTSLGSMLRIAEAVYESSPNQKVLFVFSDGEDLTEGQNLNIKLPQDICIYSIGIGSTEGTTIPITLEDGRVQDLKDREGHIVKTVLDEATLKKLASETGGQYFPFVADLSATLLQTLQEQFPLNLSAEAGVSVEHIPYERYQWFLFPALLFLLIEILIGTAARKPPRYGISDYYKLSIVLIFGLLWTFSSTKTLARDSKGETLFQQGQYEDALQFYEQSTANRKEKDFNQATTLIKLQRYPEAIEAFQKALPEAPVELQKKIYYNLGIALFRSGEIVENIPERRKQWETSRDAFANAIELDPDFVDAKKNWKYVDEKIKALKDTTPPQNQNDQNQNDQNQNDQNQNDQNQNDQNQNDQNQNDQNQNDQNQNDQNQNPSEPDKQDPKNDEEKNNPLQQDQNQKQPQDTEPQQDRGNNNPSPGELSSAEAKQLLDGREGDEKILPLYGAPTQITTRQIEKFW